MSTKDQTQPLGPLVGAHTARRPERTTLRGRTLPYPEMRVNRIEEPP